MPVTACTTTTPVVDVSPRVTTTHLFGDDVGKGQIQRRSTVDAQRHCGHVEWIILFSQSRGVHRHAVKPGLVVSHMRCRYGLTEKTPRLTHKRRCTSPNLLARDDAAPERILCTAAR